MENMPQVPGNRAKVGQDHDAGKAVLNTLLVLNKSGAIFRSKSSKASVPSFYLCPFLCKPRSSGVSLESPRLEYIPQPPGNRAKVGQDCVSRKTVSATLSVLKRSGTIFRPKSLKPSVQSSYLCPFLCQPRRPRVRLESLGFKILPEVPGKGAKVGEDHDALKAVLATLSVLKNEVGLDYGLKAANRECDRFTCVHFSGNQGHQELL